MLEINLIGVRIKRKEFRLLREIDLVANENFIIRPLSL